MTNKEAIAALNDILIKLENTTTPAEVPFNLEEYITFRTALQIAIKNLQETELEGKTFLKRRSGDYVTYKVDWLLDHLSSEIYILELSRRDREKNIDQIEAERLRAESFREEGEE